MAKTKAIPPRGKMKAEDLWDLTEIFASDAAWERDFQKMGEMVEGFSRFKGKLGNSAKVLRACYDFETEFEQLAEKLGAYAYLKASENVAESAYQGMIARYTHAATRASEAASFIAPEIQAIPAKRMALFLKSEEVAPYRFSLEKLLRYRPHILSPGEERILAMQGEVAGTAGRVFNQLNDADLKFGFVKDETGQEVELSQSSFRSLLDSPKRPVRKQAFQQFYAQYKGHENALAAMLNASVLQDVYEARVRNHPSAREAALFADKVPVAVYDSLIETVHAHLPVLFRYLELRKRALRVKELQPWDIYTPIVKAPKVHIPYGEGAEMICQALEPLGDEYVTTLRQGVTDGRWVDRYENQGKRSGAFSFGCYGCPPFILMNYKEDVLDGVFTLAHEGGHSMHSWYSQRAQPYQYAHYTIFVAEVASTFNEQLLGRYLLGRAKTKKERATLINKEIEEIRGTLIRQTMFAEFEQVIHALAEEGQPLTIDVFRAQYRALLERYFGTDFVIDEALELEGLRIPHFYNAFYVYKYATGISAAIALAQMVLQGGKTERERYLRFLESGGSRFPLDQLRQAGVDLRTPAPVEHAMSRFKELVDELETLL